VERKSKKEQICSAADNSKNAGMGKQMSQQSPIPKVRAALHIIDLIILLSYDVHALDLSEYPLCSCSHQVVPHSILKKGTTPSPTSSCSAWTRSATSSSISPVPVERSERNTSPAHFYESQMSTQVSFRRYSFWYLAFGVSPLEYVFEGVVFYVDFNVVACVGK
jgi:hypothetical protein